MRRRTLLLGALATTVAGCVRPPPRNTPIPPSVGLAEVDAWNSAARAILTDAQEVLRVFDMQAASLISTSARTPLRTTRELVWDPPTTRDWNAAPAQAQALKERSVQLYGAVVNSTPDTTLWRERRTLAEATRSLSDMADALVQYHGAVDALEPNSDGSPALPILAHAWDRWEASAAHWNVGRATLLPCA